MNKEMEITLLEIARTVLAGHTPAMRACRGEILEALDIINDDADILQQLIEECMGEDEHFRCCHAPKDMGHMFGCPNSVENFPE